MSAGASGRFARAAYPTVDAGDGYSEWVPLASFQRARSAEHKEQRATDLLEAARALATEQDLGTLTLTAIATRAGVHVSAVRRYYSAREDILLTLTAQECQAWGKRATTMLAPRRVRAPEDVAGVLAGSLAQQALLCTLLAHVPLSLERAGTLECIRHYRIARSTATSQVATAVTRSLPMLPRPPALELVSTALVLAGPLWQSCHPREDVVRLCVDEPQLAAANGGFVAELGRLLTVLARGLSAGPKP